MYLHTPLYSPTSNNLVSNFLIFSSKSDLSYTFADLSKREADLALRVTANPPDDLVGRKLNEATMAAYAHKDYVKKHKPQEPNSTALRIASGTPDTFECLHGFEHLNIMGYFDNMMLRITLAIQGAGVASLPTIIGDSEPCLERLSEPLHMADVWLLYHMDLRYTSRVRAVRDFLQQSVERRLEKRAKTI